MIGTAMLVGRYLAMRTLALAAMTTIHMGPAPTAPTIADAIATVVTTDCMEPGALGSCALDAVALAVTAEQEGHLCLGAACLRGDHGRSVSTYQLLTPDPAQREAYDRDLLAATRRAYFVMRASARQCPSSMLAGYCGGCNRRGARAIAEPRLALARTLYALFRPEEDSGDDAFAELP